MSLTEKIKNAVKDYAQYLTIPIPFVGDYYAFDLPYKEKAKFIRNSLTICCGAYKMGLLAMLISEPSAAPIAVLYVGMVGTNAFFHGVKFLLDENQNSEAQNKSASSVE